MRAICTYEAAAGLIKMKRVLLSVALFAVCASLRAAGLPATIVAQLPAGYEPMVFHEGPRIEGGRHSWLVVAHRRGDSADNPSPRPLMIFEEQALYGAKRYRLRPTLDRLHHVPLRPTATRVVLR